MSISTKTRNTSSINLIRESARDFALQYIKPYVMDWDENQHFPKEVLQKAGEYGFMGILVPEEYGGSGLGYHEYVAIIDEISRVDPSIGLSIAAHNSLCTNHIYKFGSNEHHKKYLKLLATGKMIGAWALTEPNTGSDSGKMASTAVKKGNKWVLNGTKNFITHGKSGDLAVAIFRTGPVGEKNNSTAFIIERGNMGLTSGRKENKLGMRASETAEMIFSDCIIDDSNRLGEVGGGVTLWKDGSEVALVELPIAGLMSDSKASEVAVKTQDIVQAMTDCGCNLNNAYMQHTLLALVVIPELRISDLGLVDVNRFELTEVISSKP